MSSFIYILHYIQLVIMTCFLFVNTIHENLISKSFCNFSFKDFSFSEDFSFTSLVNRSIDNHSAYSSESFEPFMTLIIEKYSTLLIVSV